MTLLVLVLLAAGGLTAGQGLRGRLGRRPVRSHQQVLRTLDDLTRAQGPADTRHERVAEARQHVRVVSADEAPHRQRPRHRHEGRARASMHRGGAAAFRAPLPAPDEQVARPPVAAPLPASAAGPVVRIDATAAPDVTPARTAVAAGGAGTASSPTAAPARSLRPALAAPAVGAPVRSARAHRGRRRGRPTAPARRRVVAAGAAGVAALVVVAAVAALAARSPSRTSPVAARPPAQHSAHPVQAPPATPAAPPTTVAPVALASTGPAGSVYTLNGPVTISLTAAAPSWIQVRTGGQAGAIVWQGVLAAGQTETVPGPAWVRLGNPTGVTVVVNGTPVQAPSAVSGEPTNLQFG